MKIRLLAVLILLPLLFISSCKKDDLNSVLTGPVVVRLANDTMQTLLEEVNIDVRNVEIHIAGSTAGDWYKLPTRAGIYNIISLSNGIDALIVSEKVPTGQITAVRLNLGTNNSVKKNGVLYPVTIPEGEKEGLTYLFYRIIGSTSADFVILFNTAESVVLDAPGSYHLRPMIRVK